MKKLLAILLCIATLFCFAACSEEDDDDDRKPSKKKPNKNNVEIVLPEKNEEELPAEPTEEERDRLYQYYYLCSQCQDLSGDLSQDQLQNLYRQLQEAEDLDRWIGSEYVENLYKNEFGEEDIIIDRQTLLNKFSLLEDVLLHYRRASWSDNLGNTETREHGDTFWDYDANGEVCRIRNEKVYMGDFGFRPSDFRFDMEYDADGKPLCKRYYLDNGDVLYMVVYAYNENGQCISEEYRSNTNSEFVYFTYDENGRLAQSAWKNIFEYTIDYAYDEEGRLIKETLTEFSSRSINKTLFPTMQKVREYTYDDNGHLQGGAFSEIDYYNIGEDISGILDGTLSFVTDEEGRILSETRTYNPKVTYPGKSNSQTIPHTVSSETYEYTYGTYYICAE